MNDRETHEPQPTGALEELAGDPSSRKRFLKAAGGTGAASAFALFLAACGSKKTKLTPGGSNPNTGAGVGTDQYGKGDLGIARYAVTLEYLAVDFYNAAGKSGKLSGRAAGLFKSFGQHEQQHAKALEQVIGKLGGQPPARPRAQKFPVGSQQSILTFALNLESLAAAALLAQADRIQDKEFLAAALSMHSVEGRHVATVASLLNQNPAPDAFAVPANAADVLNQLHSLTAQQ